MNENPNQLSGQPGTRLLLLFLLIAAVTFLLMWRVADRRSIREVAKPTPDWLPLLVFTPGQVDIIWYDQLDDFKREHPDYSFLVPRGQEDSMNEKLLASYRRKVPTADAFPKFEVEELAPGRQSLELGLYGDGETVVWYEVTDKEISPKYYKMYGPLFPVFPLFWSLMISPVLCGLIYGLLKIYRDARKLCVPVE
jgi:hypothetical protein